MGVTQELCRRIVAFADAPDSVILTAKQLVLDGFAVALAGSREEAAPGVLAAHLREIGGNPQSSAFGFGFKTGPPQAAYLNGVSMHVLDFEPMWNPPTHPTSTTLPAAAALAERLGSSGRELIVAFLKGCEIQGRILLGARQFSPRELTYHPPGVVGVLGAAVAAAHLLALDAQRLQHALGIAASRAGSLLANVGSMTKSTHCGLAASLGLDAAMLAARGFTANTAILESGYFKTFFKNEIDEDDLLAFGRPLRLIDPGVAIKLFPSQYGTHFGITAGIELHGRVDPEGIETVELRVPVMPYVDRAFPSNGLDGKFSFQYTFAAALLDGDVTVHSFSDERRFRPDMVSLLGKIRLIPDESIPAEFARMHVAAHVTSRDGSLDDAVCTGPKGLWGHTPITPQEHGRKIQACLSVALDDAKAVRLRTLLATLETLRGDQLQECWDLLRGRARVF